MNRFRFRRLSALTVAVVWCAVLNAAPARASDLPRAPAAADAQAPEPPASKPPAVQPPASGSPAPATSTAKPPAAKPAMPPKVVEKPAQLEHMRKAQAEGVLGEAVLDAKGDQIGRIVNVLINAQGTPHAAVIEFAGFLGVGNRNVAVVWKALEFKVVNNHIVISLDMDAEKLKAMPTYTVDANSVPVAAPAKSTPKPDTSKPDTSKPDTSKPGISKPGISKPGTSKPGISKPDTSKPASDHQGAISPTGAQ